MALVQFENTPSTNTPISATNLNNNFNELENTFGNVIMKSAGDITSAQITSSNGYGIVLVISSAFVCVVQLSRTNTYIYDIYGTHGTMQTSISNNVLSLTDLYDWDHYIFIGSSVIESISI